MPDVALMEQTGGRGERRPRRIVIAGVDMKSAAVTPPASAGFLGLAKPAKKRVRSRLRGPAIA
jgi:hypothetical protein